MAHLLAVLHFIPGYSHFDIVYAILTAYNLQFAAVVVGAEPVYTQKAVK
jgi:hypothetical protein